MKLRFILGKPGSGKSTLCVDEIVKASSEGRQAVYIVPEQYSLESERILCAKSNNNVLMNSDVLSFIHLAHRVILKTGAGNEKILDDNGKALLLRKIINDLLKTNSLIFYGKSATKQGFIDSISDLITECIQYSVSPELLLDKSRLLDNKNKRLADKLHDIGTIFSAFNENINTRYIAKESLLDILAERIPQTTILNNTEVWIDSFTRFNPQDFKIIEALIRVCPRVNIALTASSDKVFSAYNSFDPYYDIKYSINKIKHIAENLKAEIEPTVYTDNDLRHNKAPEIEHLTYNYFDKKPYTKKCKNIKIYSAATIDAELDKTAGEILSLLRENHYRCSDIAVLVSSESYYLPLKNIFEKYNIPYFTDIKSNILFHPLTELVRSFFAILNSNYGTSQVFRMLKTGFNTFKYNEIALAENYCIACGIKGKKWFNEWEYIPSSQFKEQLNDLNDIRGYICDMLENIKTLRSKGSTVKDISAKVYKLFDYFNVQETLTEFINHAIEENDEVSARIHKQIWSIIGNIFSKMCEIMGDDVISFADYGKILETGLQNATLGIIPPTCDSVTIAEFNRSRLPNIKALFMLGVNEGVIPPHRIDTNILSDRDKAILASEGCELSCDSLRLINRDMFNIYSYITKPSEKLYLSYKINTENNSKSPLITDLCDIFKITPEDVISTVSDVSGIYSEEQAYELLLKHLASINNDKKKIAPVYKAVYAYLVQNKYYKRRLEQIEKWLSIKDSTKERLSEKTAKQLYLDENNAFISGISRLEDFAECPYMFFLRYGLNANERDEYEPSALHYGTLFHSVLKQFSIKAEKKKSWKNLDDDYIKNTVDEIINNSIAEFNDGYLDSSATGRYVSDILKNTAYVTIKAFSQNINGFVPCGYEVSFGPSSDKSLPPLVYDLDDGLKLVLTGSIDRVDLYKSPDNNIYVKITDYKTSDKNKTIFNNEKMYLGVQLQLPLYIEAYTKSNPGYKPGGYFYYRISNPVYEKSPQDTHLTLLSGGIALKDDNYTVINALSESERKKITDKRTKASYLLMHENEFDDLRNSAVKIVTDIGKEITKGTINAYPLEKTNPCKYCKYSAICCLELCSGKKDKQRTVAINANKD